MESCFLTRIIQKQPANIDVKLMQINVKQILYRFRKYLKIHNTFKFSQQTLPNSFEDLNG
jgi:hypothetical protein